MSAAPTTQRAERNHRWQSISTSNTGVTADAAELYEVSRWGNGYFSVGPNGHLLVHPDKNPTKSIDLKSLVDRLQFRGIDLPILLRFGEILQHRLGRDSRRVRHGDQGERIPRRLLLRLSGEGQPATAGGRGGAQFGRPYRFGLEAGSKPELLAVIALADNDTPIICNGFKDAEFIETAMLAQKIGRHVIPVVERFSELHLILEYAEKLGVRPRIGMRVKLATRGSGRWQASGGFRSKFGLTASELVKGLELLASKGHGRLPPVAAFPSGQPDHQHPPYQGGSQRGLADLHRTGETGCRPPSISTSAADWASTTTARRPTSSRA
jgi:arginine decarboxylase